MQSKGSMPSMTEEVEPVQPNEKKGPTFSKVILVVVSIFTIALTVFTCVMIWRTMDLTPLAYLIPGAFAELASATGFYFNKAKAENKIKLMSAYGVKPDADSFNESM